MGGFVCNSVSGVFANTGFLLLLAEILLIRGLFRKCFERVMDFENHFAIC
jgi:hypothetical protein